MRHTHRLPFFLFLLAMLVAPVLSSACGGGSGSPAPGTGDEPDDPVVDPPPSDWPPLEPLAATVSVTSELFATSPVCWTCHANSDEADAMRDAADRPVAPMDLWRASSMGGSARDPIWRAVLSAEIATNPTQEAALSSICTRCHAPMAHETLRRDGLPMSPAVLAGGDDLAQLGLDGVSCALCHQVAAAGLGTEASYTGGFTIDAGKAIFGGHPGPNPMPMFRHTGFTPAYSAHNASSALCGTCHTVETHALTEDGTPTGHVLLEQGVYFEWLNSAFNDEGDTPGPDAASCADCHLASLDEDGNPIRTQIAHAPGGGDYGPGAAPVRDTFNRHVLVGGNTLLPELLRDQATNLQPNASTAALDANLVAARNLLTRSTARLSLIGTERENDALLLAVRVENLAGHKFPTAYPSRRGWLRVRVRNAAGTFVFRSGEHDAEGRLLTPLGGVHASEVPDGPFEPHHTLISSESQVQIYESVMADAAGEPTWRLLRGSAYAKDNRLLPRGWSGLHEDADRAGPRGAASEDEDFVGGRDDVTYRVTAPAAAGPYTVEVDLLYQVLKERYLAELYLVDTAEIAALRKMLETAKRGPELVAHLEATPPE